MKRTIAHRRCRPTWSSISAAMLLAGCLSLLAYQAGLPGRVQAAEPSPVTLNQKDDGYRGIWYYNQKSNDEYVYKYSGGLGTYCAKHQPFAVYRPEVQKTFFCYGGSTKQDSRQLLHMVSYYDHRTGQVPRPTILLDKQTSDAHDNPVISVDDAGYVWIFSTSHGRSRPSYLHRSRQPYHIEAFDRVDASYQAEDGTRQPLNNFSYLQTWHVPGQGFRAFFTHYNDPAQRTNMFMTSRDGTNWSAWRRLAAIQEGHYQISAANERKAACTFDFHPAGKGLNWRTNLYYLETLDGGQTWRTAEGQPVELPLTKPGNAALVREYQSAGLLVYIKDIAFDNQDRPVILYLTSKGYESGPANGPRTWMLARWTGSQWSFHDITTSDNNYDMGSFYLEPAGRCRLIAPTETGPQPYNPGGEMAMWLREDNGRQWHKVADLTKSSPLNHTFARRPVQAHPDFYALWADGHGRQPSPSRLYFCNQQGHVYRLPETMTEPFARPLRINAAAL